MYNKLDRRSIRLYGYDYSQEGLYFLTICCQDRICFLGEIIASEMILNEIGKQAKNCWLEIPNHFNNVKLHEYVIMPNHIHGIIQILGAKNFLPNEKNILYNGTKDISPLRGTSKTIGSIVRGFKIGVTKWVRQNTDIYNLWQRNYYEHIIRSNESYQRITDYIQNNPQNWMKDKFHQ
ncbi:transposase [Sphingobacterium wenxiniae]|uniref:REP element-mobilizing transposase RayT n=1 Tax=Sphingobacterium wenxiniae TaxID=683125 RepID=A0A1I6RY02_9SPHI|nr:transposase [Sphingobacterium wenxiniae]SFS69579.1 REP element-mobilizing transposase RayT [Sphingobacterium wenxiniae]